eukprot:gene2071-18255_t
MQLHSSAEYFLATQEGRMGAHSKGKAAWCKYTMMYERDKRYFEVQGVDFEEESWGRCLLEIKGCGYAILASNCVAAEEEDAEGDQGQDSKSRPTQGEPIPPGKCFFQPNDADLPEEGFVRCLGYVGSYMKEFASAAGLLLKMPAPGSASRWLLEAKTLYTTVTHQEQAVRNLRPGKSTTIYHIVDSRVKEGNKTLVTCTRNQAVNAVVEKVKDFGCVVFGNPKRLGIDSLKYTLDALVERDPIVCWWKQMSAYLSRAVEQLSGPTDMSMYPRLQRLADIEADDVRYPSQAKRQACGRWFTVLKAPQALGAGGRRQGDRGTGARVAGGNVLEVKDCRMARLSACEQRRVALWTSFLKSADKLFLANVKRVEALRQVGILNRSRVFLCTIESTARMAREVSDVFGAMQPAKKEGGQRAGGRYSRAALAAMQPAATKEREPLGCGGCIKAALAAMQPAKKEGEQLGGGDGQFGGDVGQYLLGGGGQFGGDGVQYLGAYGCQSRGGGGWYGGPQEEDTAEQDGATLKIDTCIVDEAGSVLDLLERCVDAGMEPWFLATQYRMHPRLSTLVSQLFYEGRLKSAEPAHLPRPHPQPCLWVKSGSYGDEIEHEGGGFSNEVEALLVAEHAQRVVSSGLYPLSYVITFYNKQKQALRKQFQAMPMLASAIEDGTLLILSVDACQGSEADCVIISP